MTVVHVLHVYPYYLEQTLIIKDSLRESLSVRESLSEIEFQIIPTIN